jgi:streptomycin 6-kinase
VIEIPDAFARATVEREGQPGAAWLAELPGIVDDLLQRWDCSPDGNPLHGQVGIIVPVRRKAYGPAVLKVSFPHPGNVHEPDAFAVWRGRGAVSLYERDDERFAMLLERASMAGLVDLDDGDEAAKVAGRLSSRLTVPAPPGLPRLRDRAGAWADEMSKDGAELAHNLSRRALGAAMATALELGGTQPDLLIHGDFHATNILRAEREPWLVIDPKGYAGDPAYDGGGMVIKWRPLRVLELDALRKTARRGLDIFAEAAELNPERVRRWAQFHAVRGSLWGRRYGFSVARGGSRLTEFAERIAELLTDAPRVIG